MSPHNQASVSGRQVTLAQWLQNSESLTRPDISHYMRNQPTLSTDRSGNWNMQSNYIVDKNKYNKEFWGDSMDNKKEGSIRFVSKNIQGLGIVAGNHKEDELKAWIVNRDIDIIGIQEPNVNWYKCKIRDRFSERIRSPEWEYVKYSVAFNRHDTQFKHQFGYHSWY